VVTIRQVDDVDDVLAASDLFDLPADAGHTRRFLDAPDHFLFLAYEADEPVGFVSGVETLHPDKGAEMFLNELAVAPPHRRQGIGKALVTALHDLARERGCLAMWVLTDHDNPAARATYESAGSNSGTSHVMYDWPLTEIGVLDVQPPGH
jgi:ribosomal protein S18 acetylase RimI-like enzyme